MFSYLTSHCNLTISRKGGKKKLNTNNHNKNKHTILWKGQNLINSSSSRSGPKEAGSACAVCGRQQTPLPASGWGSLPSQRLQAPQWSGAGRARPASRCLPQNHAALQTITPEPAAEGMSPTLLITNWACCQEQAEAQHFCSWPKFSAKWLAPNTDKHPGTSQRARAPGRDSLLFLWPLVRACLARIFG